MKRSGPLPRRTPLNRTGFKPADATEPPVRKPKAKRKRDKPKGFPASVREAAKRRDGGCKGRAVWPDVSCSGGLHAHHVILRSQGGPNTLDNALTLCGAHHLHAHDVDRKGAEAAGIIKRSPSKIGMDQSVLDSLDEMFADIDD